MDFTPMVYMVAGAVIAIIITWGYDRNKNEKDDNETYQKMLFLITEEVRRNLRTLTLIKLSLTFELLVLKENKSLTAPLPYPTTRYWDIVFSPMNSIFFKSKYLVDVGGLYRTFSVIKDAINSREHFRHQNRVVSSFPDVMSTFDIVILGQIKDCMEPCQQLLNDLLSELSEEYHNKIKEIEQREKEIEQRLMKIEQDEQQELIKYINIKPN